MSGLLLISLHQAFSLLIISGVSQVFHKDVEPEA
jgi:hypothetical protein